MLTAPNAMFKGVIGVTKNAMAQVSLSEFYTKLWTILSATHISPRWGLDLGGYGISIDILKKSVETPQQRPQAKTPDGAAPRCIRVYFSPS